MTWRRVHQLLALGLAVFWLIQVLTGVLLTFRQEIGHFLAGGRDAPLRVEMLGRRIESIRAAGSTVTSVWVTNFTATRFDVLYTDRANSERRMQVNGAGELLRDGSADSIFATLTDIHTTLLVGDRGKWIIAASGILLFSNLILGLKLAWPRRGYWRKSLALRTSRHSVANVYGLHRTLGLYLGFPLLVLVLAGILLCFDDDIAAALHVERPPPVASAVSIELTPARAMSLGLARFPGATLTALSMPTEQSPWYRVRLHAPGEVWRMYGQTDSLPECKGWNGPAGIRGCVSPAGPPRFGLAVSAAHRRVRRGCRACSAAPDRSDAADPGLFRHPPLVPASITLRRSFSLAARFTRCVTKVRLECAAESCVGGITNALRRFGYFHPAAA